VGLVLVLTIAGSTLARSLAERDARRDSARRVELAAALIGSRISEATSLTTSLRRFISTEGAAGVTNDQFAQLALRWLSPEELPAAAWVEQIPAGERADYERRVGHAIVTPGQAHNPEPPRSSYLPATLVSGFPPMDVRGIDLSHEHGMQAAVVRTRQPGGVVATPIAERSDGTSGLFLVAESPNVIDGALRPGVVVVFVSEETLRAAARNPAGLEFVAVGSPAARRTAANTAREEFTVAGRRFAVVLPRASVTGAGAILPWLIIPVGLVLAALAGALGVNAARRAKSQADLDRIFNLSPDLIAVADFEGRFTRVNPAVEQVLGYTKEEVLSRPYMDFVHPEDRESTAVETAAIGNGRTTLSFENRYLRKDGSYRVLEWTGKPVVEDGVMYGVARDVTERRRSEVEQVALRRVATLAAEGVEPDQLFTVVAEEVARVLDVRIVSVERYDSDGTSTVVASREYPGFPVGSIWPLDAPSLGATILETARPARIDDYTGLDSTRAAAMRASGVNSAVGVPILVDGRVWGAIFVGNSDGKPVPAATEEHLARFADLVATAIARAESTAARERLGDEQAALRRVATLVAEGARTQDLFEAVAGEVGRLLPVVSATMGRYESDGSVTTVASWSSTEAVFPPGRRWPIKGTNVAWLVLQTGRPARIDDFSAATDPIGVAVREAGYKSAIGSPVVVEGRLWGVISAASTEVRMPPGTEARLASFTELVATAIANAESSAELAASRRRIVAASDDARRRIERDLHDGVQQQLVSLGLELGAMKADPPTGDALKEQLASVTEDVGSVLEDLVEIARGIHPAILSQGGLAAALKGLARRSAVPVELQVQIDEPLSDEVEVAAYYVAAEALTNAAKHARASLVHMDVTTGDGTVTLMLRDDGIGGADPGKGSGLLGLQDRVEALGGAIKIVSSAGSGTCVVVTLPVATEPDREICVLEAAATVDHDLGRDAGRGAAEQ
jgi:PAS domain S-box-containing protein